MQVHDLSPAPGSTKAPKRVARGIGGKGGKTAGRGTKGQRSRGRGKVARGFEGGQMPLKQRVPKLKGFNNPFRVEYAAVNLDTISELGESKVDPEVMVAHGLVRNGAFVKVLARGEADPLGMPTIISVNALWRTDGTAAGTRSVASAAEFGEMAAVNGTLFMTAYRQANVGFELYKLNAAGNGIAGVFAPELLRRLGCEVVELYCESDGTFPNHLPDPEMEENMRDLVARVLEARADVGLAYDGDADRVGIVDEKGRRHEADLLLALLGRDLLSRHPGAIIETINVDLPAERHPALIGTDKFATYAGRIRTYFSETGHE